MNAARVDDFFGMVVGRWASLDEADVQKTLQNRSEGNVDDYLHQSTRSASEQLYVAYQAGCSERLMEASEFT